MTKTLTQNKTEESAVSQLSNKDEINLIDILEILVRHKFLIFLNIFIFSLASIIYVQTTTPVFRTKIFFLQPSESFIPKSFLGMSSHNLETDSNKHKKILEKFYKCNLAQSLRRYKK
jgi:hypothetical protein